MSTGFGRLEYNMGSEQQSLLPNKPFRLRPLGTVGHLAFWRLLIISWQPIACFLFSLLILIPIDFRNNNKQLALVLYVLGVILLLVYPVVSCFTLTWGIVATRVHSRIRWPAVLYWMWWPISRLGVCVLGVVLGTIIGSHLWSEHFLPYAQLRRLQAYQEVNPDIATAVRLEDAGLVLFNSTATVSRLGAGCHKNGRTYCVAPIVGTSASKPHQDLFMVGVDCCSCPGEFRCGDWSKPAALGGMRVVDAQETEFFRYAAEDWSAAHNVGLGKSSLFLQWVTDPLAEHQAMYTSGQRLLCLALLAGPIFFLVLVTALNGLLGLLVDAGYAAPIEPPKKPDLSTWPPLDAGSNEDNESAAIASEPEPKYVFF